MTTLILNQKPIQDRDDGNQCQIKRNIGHQKLLLTVHQKQILISKKKRNSKPIGTENRKNLH